MIIFIYNYAFDNVVYKINVFQTCFSDNLLEKWIVWGNDKMVMIWWLILAFCDMITSPLWFRSLAPFGFDNGLVTIWHQAIN